MKKITHVVVDKLEDFIQNRVKILVNEQVATEMNWTTSNIQLHTMVKDEVQQRVQDIIDVQN